MTLISSGNPNEYINEIYSRASYYTKRKFKLPHMGKDKSFNPVYYIDKELPVTVTITSLKDKWYVGHCYLPENPNIKHICRIHRSMIALNVERDPDKWIRKTVTAVPVAETNESDRHIFICSRRKHLQYNGNILIYKLYSEYFRSEAKKFNQYNSEYYIGIVTGVIGTASCCGVFLELSGLNINGFLPCDNYKLVDYRIGDRINVRISDITPNGKIFSKNVNGNIEESGLNVILSE